MKLHFKAPWGRLLTWTSALTTVICVGISASGFLVSPPHNLVWTHWIHAGLPLLILAGAAPFLIRGYTITPETLLIHRLFWDTRFPLTGLRAVESLPNAMAKSLRTCGNGGLYSFTGWYRSNAFGSYRAYVTDLNRTVVLHDGKRPIVVSPHDPEAFVEALKAHLPATPP